MSDHCVPILLTAILNILTKHLVNSDTLSDGESSRARSNIHLLGPRGTIEITVQMNSRELLVLILQIFTFPKHGILFY